MRNKDFYIGVDFDGTCCFHTYPEVGGDVPGAERVLSKLSAAGHKIILYTMRGAEPLKKAVQWFEERKIPLFGININPTQSEWTDSPKPYVNIYIGDECLGCPLDFNANLSDRPYVDWDAVEQILNKNLIFFVPVDGLYPYPNLFTVKSQHV